MSCGPALVLLAGIGMNATAWRPVRSRLDAERELVLIFGNSEALPDDTDSTIEALTDAVEGCLPELGLERPHAAGNSLGGAVALALARRDAVASVTAISPVGFWSVGHARRAAAADPGASRARAAPERDACLAARLRPRAGERRARPGRGGDPARERRGARG